MPARLTPAQREEARALYLADTSLSVDAVAARYGVGHSVMQRALADIARSPGAWRRVSMTTAKMIRLRDKGVTLEEIGRQAGISKSGVSVRIRRYEEGKTR